jgi:signal peptidase I
MRHRLARLPAYPAKPGRIRPRRLLAGLTAAGLALAGVTWLRRARLEPVRVAGRSMIPGLPPGALLAVGPLAGPPARGQLVVAGTRTGPGELVKRVAGLPGEHVRLAGGVLEVDGRVVPEPYLDPGAPAGPAFEVRLGAGEYLLLGDNRAVSSDGRAFGPVTADRIAARVRFAYWPPAAWPGVARVRRIGHHRRPERHIAYRNNQGASKSQ